MSAPIMADRRPAVLERQPSRTCSVDTTKQLDARDRERTVDSPCCDGTDGEL